VEAPWTRGAGLKLSIDVLHVSPAHDEDVQARLTERLEPLTNGTGIGAPVRHGSAVPVKDERLEALVENPRHRHRTIVTPDASCR